MKHLSGADNMALELEQGKQYLHVAGLGIYDPSTAPDGKVRFKQVLDFFAKRTDLAKVFRWRLVVPPFGIDRPYWIDDGELDIEYHVRHVALPKPGDWRQLMIQVARIHARPLDRSKPLWQVYVIEGLDNVPHVPKGSFALYIKFHHAAVDGEAGAQIIRSIHSYTPELDHHDHDGPHAILTDRDPTLIEQYARAIAHRANQVVEATKLVASLATRIASLGSEAIQSGQAAELARSLAEHYRHLVAGDETAPTAFGRKPHSRFDAPLSAHRVVDAVGFSLTDCKRIRARVAGVTINDIFLAACGGALRKYLEGKRELPERSLTALMPISTRGHDKNPDVTNQVGGVPVPLGTDVADPLERLHAVQLASRKAKNASALLGHDLPARLVEVLPTYLSTRLVTGLGTSLFNTTVSNVRGPEVPLYMAGAKMRLFLPVSAIMDGVGLNMTGFSYEDTLWVCFVSCREMLPDPAEFSRCLSESFDEIRDAALAPAADAVVVESSAAPAKERKGRPASAAGVRKKKVVKPVPPASDRARRASRAGNG